MKIFTSDPLLPREGKDLGEESKGETLEGANDPKTVGDMQSHIAMFYGIRKAFPDINVISEEHGEKTVDLNSVSKLETSNPEVEGKGVLDDLVKMLSIPG